MLSHLLAPARFILLFFFIYFLLFYFHSLVFILFHIFFLLWPTFAPATSILSDNLCDGCTPRSTTNINNRRLNAGETVDRVKQYPPPSSRIVSHSFIQFPIGLFDFFLLLLLLLLLLLFKFCIFKNGVDRLFEMAQFSAVLNYD